MNLKEMKERFNAALLAAKAVVDAAEAGNRDFTDEEKATIVTKMDEAKDLKEKIKQAEGDAALRKQIADLGSAFDLAPGGDGQKPIPGGPAGRGKTLGEQFVESDVFKAWYKNVAPTGHIPEGTKGFLSPPVEYKTLLTGDSNTSAGAFVQTDYTGIYEPLGRRPLVLRDLISQRTTTSDTVEYVRQTAQVTQAAPTAEATNTSTGTKPEGAMAFEKVTATVKTIAVWIPATKRALADVAQLRGIIDQELRDDLMEDLEDELVSGDNSGEHFDGILHVSGTLEQDWDTDLLTTARKAITAVRVIGRARPTAWLLNPYDAEKVDLLKDEQGRYYYGGPQQGGVNQLWRYPVVECEAIPEGTGVIGDWRKMILWDREQATIQVSDSHSDFFVKNLVAVLAEMRAAMGVIRPTAFCIVALSSGS